MTRDVLLSILRNADGVTERAGVFEVAKDHRATFYLGSDGRGMSVHEVRSIAARDGHVELNAPEPGTIYTTYEHVEAIAIKPPKETMLKKAGFA